MPSPPFDNFAEQQRLLAIKKAQAEAQIQAADANRAANIDTLHQSGGAVPGMATRTPLGDFQFGFDKAAEEDGSRPDYDLNASPYEKYRKDPMFTGTLDSFQEVDPTTGAHNPVNPNDPSTYRNHEGIAPPEYRPRTPLGMRTSMADRAGYAKVEAEKAAKQQADAEEAARFKEASQGFLADRAYHRAAGETPQSKSLMSVGNETVDEKHARWAARRAAQQRPQIQPPMSPQYGWIGSRRQGTSTINSYRQPPPSESQQAQADLDRARAEAIRGQAKQESSFGALQNWKVEFDYTRDQLDQTKLEIEQQGMTDTLEKKLEAQQSRIELLLEEGRKMRGYEAPETSPQDNVSPPPEPSPESPMGQPYMGPAPTRRSEMRTPGRGVPVTGNSEVLNTPTVQRPASPPPTTIDPLKKYESKLPWAQDPEAIKRILGSVY